MARQKSNQTVQFERKNALRAAFGSVPKFAGGGPTLPDGSRLIAEGQGPMGGPAMNVGDQRMPTSTFTSAGQPPPGPKWDTNFDRNFVEGINAQIKARGGPNSFDDSNLPTARVSDGRARTVDPVNPNIGSQVTNTALAGLPLPSATPPSVGAGGASQLRASENAIPQANPVFTRTIDTPSVVQQPAQVTGTPNSSNIAGVRRPSNVTPALTAGMLGNAFMSNPNVQGMQHSLRTFGQVPGAVGSFFGSQPQQPRYGGPSLSFSSAKASRDAAGGLFAEGGLVENYHKTMDEMTRGPVPSATPVPVAPVATAAPPPVAPQPSLGQRVGNWARDFASFAPSLVTGPSVKQRQDSAMQYPAAGNPLTTFQDGGFVPPEFGMAVLPPERRTQGASDRDLGASLPGADNPLRAQYCSGGRMRKTYDKGGRVSDRPDMGALTESGLRQMSRGLSAANQMDPTARRGYTGRTMADLPFAAMDTTVGMAKTVGGMAYDTARDATSKGIEAVAKKFTKGGTIVGPRGDKYVAKQGKDTEHIMAAAGEYILPKKTVDAMGGPDALDQIVMQTNGRAPRGSKPRGSRLRHAMSGLEAGPPIPVEETPEMLELAKRVEAARAQGETVTGQHMAQPRPLGPTGTTPIDPRGAGPSITAPPPNSQTVAGRLANTPPDPFRGAPMVSDVDMAAIRGRPGPVDPVTPATLAEQNALRRQAQFARANPPVTPEMINSAQRFGAAPAAAPAAQLGGVNDAAADAFLKSKGVNFAEEQAAKEAAAKLAGGAPAPAPGAPPAQGGTPGLLQRGKNFIFGTPAPGQVAAAAAPQGNALRAAINTGGGWQGSLARAALPLHVGMSGLQATGQVMNEDQEQKDKYARSLGVEPGTGWDPALRILRGFQTLGQKLTFGALPDSIVGMGGTRGAPPGAKKDEATTAAASTATPGPAWDPRTPGRAGVVINDDDNKQYVSRVGNEYFGRGYKPDNKPFGMNEIQQQRVNIAGLGANDELPSRGVNDTSGQKLLGSGTGDDVADRNASVANWRLRGEMERRDLSRGQRQALVDTRGQDIAQQTALRGIGAQLRGQDLAHVLGREGHGVQKYGIDVGRQNALANLRYSMAKDMRDYATGRQDKAFEQNRQTSEDFDKALLRRHTKVVDGKEVADTEGYNRSRELIFGASHELGIDPRQLSKADQEEFFRRAEKEGNTEKGRASIYGWLRTTASGKPFTKASSLLQTNPTGVRPGMVTDWVDTPAGPRTAGEYQFGESSSFPFSNLGRVPHQTEYENLQSLLRRQRENQ